MRSVARLHSSLGLIACGLAVAGAFSPFPAFGNAKRFNAHQNHPLQASARSSHTERIGALSMVDSSLRDVASRRRILLFAAGLGAQFVPGVAYAEEGEAVCTNPLGCEIPKKLAPPKRVFKGGIG
jgi:hypothetical protein